MGAPKGNKFALGNKGGSGGGRPRNVDYAPFLKILEGRVKIEDIEIVERKVKRKQFEWIERKLKSGKLKKERKLVTVEEIEKTFKTIWDALAYYVLQGDKDMIKTVLNKFYPDVRQIEANVNEQLDKEDMKQYSNEELDTIIAEGKAIKKSRSDSDIQSGES